MKEDADQLKSSADQLLAGIQGTESMSQETGSGDQLGDTLEGNAQEAGNQAEAAQAAAENLGGVESTDASYLSDSLQQAIDFRRYRCSGIRCLGGSGSCTAKRRCSQ